MRRKTLASISGVAVGAILLALAPDASAARGGGGFRGGGVPYATPANARSPSAVGVGRPGISVGRPGIGWAGGWRPGVGWGGGWGGWGWPVAAGVAAGIAANSYYGGYYGYPHSYSYPYSYSNGWCPYWAGWGFSNTCPRYYWSPDWY